MRTWALPSGVAVVASAATSEPASGSEIAKAAIAVPVAHRRQIAALQSSEPIERDRSGAEPLHGEGEVGKPVMEGKNLAREAERAHVELRMQAAVLRRHHRVEEAGLAERRDARAAGSVDIVMRQARAASPPPSAPASSAKRR